MRRLATLSILCVLAISPGLQGREKNVTSPMSGTWKCLAHGGESGDVPFTLYLRQNGKGLTGSVSAPQGDTELTAVTFKHHHLKITIYTNEHNYTLTATLAHGKLTGTWFRDGKKQGEWQGKK